MKFMSADILVTDGIGVYGGTMTSGPSTGLRWVGSIIIDFPINGHFESIPDTVSFSQQPRIIENLGNCEHLKVSGVAYCPSNNGPIRPSMARSVFGPTYDQEGVGSDILVRSADSFEAYVCLPGRFNNCPQGDWYFGIAARRVGNCVEMVSGGADLKGSYNYRGFYTFNISEFSVVNGKVFRRSTGYTSSSTQIAIHEKRPFEAIDLCKEELYSLLGQAKWRQVTEYNSAKTVHYPQALSLDPHMVFPDMRVDWGELAADAYSSVPFFKSNGIAYAKDLSDLKQSAQSTLSLLTSLGRGGRLAKKAANLFLSFYYGWRLMIKDSEELVNAYQKVASLRSNRCRCTSQRSWESRGASYTATLQCYYRRYASASKLDQFILDNDLTLTPENIWDLVPFSFVVDWFINIGNVLEDASNYYNFTQKHEVICTGRSIKAVKNTSARCLSSRYAGTVAISYYRRKYTNGPVSPTFHFSNSVNPLDHAIEGTALIVSRR